MNRKIILFLVLVLLGLTGCNTVDPPPGDKPTLTLKLEDVSCVEAWIELTTTNLQLPATVTLKQTNPNGDTKSHISILNTKDSLLYIDSLLPNKSYSFIASHSSASGGLSGISSNALSVTTMDTTSHHFTFQSWTFGEHSSSVLYDVAIINENNIIAVGEIYMNDSLGQPDPNAYNVVRWDGNEWTIGRIAFTGGCHIIYPPIRSIWAFTENDIWFASGGSLVHYDGINYYNDCRMNSIITPPLNKIWGTSSSDLYVVGSKGTIIRYNGTLWVRRETITDLNIYDIWGDYNSKTNEWEILAVASNYSSSLEKEIILIQNKQIKKISTETNPQMEPLLTTWFVPNRQYYVAGSGIYQKKLLQDSFWKHNLFNITTFATTSLRGNNINDVVGVGAFGDLVHFNGLIWKSDYDEPLLSNGSYTEVSIKNDLITAVGGNNSQAIILIGRRYIYE